MDLFEIVEKLEKTRAEVTRLESFVTTLPVDPALMLTMAGVRKRQEHLGLRFAQVTEQQGIDVCSYRLFTQGGGAPQLPALAKALLSFQTTFSTIYDAETTGAKSTSHIGAQSAAATTFGYAYSFTGSVGFTLTLPNERVLVLESDLDRAMKTLFTMLKATSSDQINAFAKGLGTGSIRALYAWVDALVRSGLGADIDWRRGTEVRASVFVDLPELESLKQAIEETSDAKTETLTVTGRLVAADFKAKDHTFRMELEDAELRGVMSPNVAEVGGLPRQYRAEVEKTTITNYAKDQEVESYTLTRLMEPL